MAEAKRGLPGQIDERAESDDDGTFLIGGN